MTSWNQKKKLLLAEWSEGKRRIFKNSKWKGIWGVCLWVCVCTSLHACVKGGEQMGIACQYFYYCHYSAAIKASYKSKCSVMDNWWASKFCWIATFNIISLGLWLGFLQLCYCSPFIRHGHKMARHMTFFTTTSCKKRLCYTMIYRMLRLLTC